MKREAWNEGWSVRKAGEQERREIQLPHDAMLEEKRVPNLLKGENSGYFPGGCYHYEKVFWTETQRLEETVWLEFDGVFRRME